MTPRTCGVVSVALLVVGPCLLTCGGLVAPIEALFHLAAGWIIFLKRVVPQLTVSGSGVVTAAVALTVFVTGFQQLASRWMAAREPAGGASWPWRWTLMATSGVVLSFVAGIAVVGGVHQLVWLANSKEPLIDSRFEVADRTQSRNNLRQIGLALHNYHDEWERFPAGGTFDQVGRPLHSWQTALLPFISESDLYKQIDLAVPWNAPANAEALSNNVSSYLNTGIRNGPRNDSERRGLSHYAANGLILNGGPGVPLKAIKDETSRTVLAGEVVDEFKAWGNPVNWRDVTLGINKAPDGFGSPFVGGAHLMFADGRVHFISDEIDSNVLEALATPDGGEVFGDF